MAVLELILMFLLPFEGIRGDYVYSYHRAGDVAVLPCFSPTYSDSCLHYHWIYYKDVNYQTEVQEGKVVENSPRAARLSVNSFCSLVINNITTEDAGGYLCKSSWNHYNSVYLRTLSFSPSDVGPTEDGDVTLLCSLRTYSSYCPEDIRWVDETRTELRGDDDGRCSSSLTVKHQKGRNRTFSCQIVGGKEVKIEASYTSVSAGTNGGLLYHRAGDHVVLSCSGPSSDPCSNVGWFYYRGGTRSRQTIVLDGKVVESSPGAARLSVNSFCSLLINNITAEDAGRYTCRLWDGDIVDSFMSLSILTLSPSDVGPSEDGNLTLQCSLSSFSSSCPENSLLWVDQTGSQLTEDDGYRFERQMGCVSVLTVKKQNVRNRTFSCRFVEENGVKIEAHYTPVSADPRAQAPLKAITWTLRLAGLILMMGVTVGLIRTRGCKKPLKESNVHDVADDDPVNYENVGERPAAPTFS